MQTLRQRFTNHWIWSSRTRALRWPDVAFVMEPFARADAERVTWLAVLGTQTGTQASKTGAIQISAVGGIQTTVIGASEASVCGVIQMSARSYNPTAAPMALEIP